MKKIKWPIIIVTTFAFFYQFAPYVGLPEDVIIVLFIISPVAVLWMVYQILKNGTPPKGRFEEYFYEDLDYKRNTPD